MLLYWYSNPMLSGGVPPTSDPASADRNFVHALDRFAGKGRVQPVMDFGPV
jgi:hypothetical protein